MSLRKVSLGKWLFGLVFSCVFVVYAPGSPALGDDKYPSATAAYADAYKFLESRDYKSAQEPLEAALKLAPDDAYRLRMYGYLKACYRLLPETEKMTEACEFIITKTKTEAERSLTARSLTSFVFQRGKLDEARKNYEARLAKDADDLIGLAMMTAITGVHYDDRELSKKYKARLDVVEAKLSGKLAEEEEKLAAADASQATDHWKQAAVYWLKAGEPKKALESAKQAEETGPEKRSEGLLYFWHAHLGDVYLGADKPRDAVRHFEKAIETTKIAGYKKDCEKKLADAQAKLAKK